MVRSHLTLALVALLAAAIVHGGSATRFREHDLLGRLQDEEYEQEGQMLAATTLVDAPDYGGAVGSNPMASLAQNSAPPKSDAPGQQQQQQQQQQQSSSNGAASEQSMAAVSGNVPDERVPSDNKQQKTTMPSEATEPDSVDMGGESGGAITATALEDSENGSADMGCTADNKSDCQKSPARLVARLSPNARPFAENDPAKKARDDMEDVNDEGDDVLKQLYQKLGDVKQVMVDEREWISRVHAILEHYRQKVGLVQNSLRKEASIVWRLKQAIIARHKILDREKLKAKIATVSQVVDRLEKATSQVEGRAVKLTTAKSDLQDTIAHLNREIEKLQKGS